MNEFRPPMRFVKERFPNVAIVGAEVGVLDGIHAGNILENIPNVKLLYLIDPYLDVFAPRKLGAKRYLNPWQNRIKWVHKKFEECTTKDIDQPLDFIYINGDHCYEHVKKDVELATQLVKKGGVISGHDFQMEEVARAVKEFCEFKEFSEDKIVGGHWWFIQK